VRDDPGAQPFFDRVDDDEVRHPVRAALVPLRHRLVPVHAVQEDRHVVAFPETFAEKLHERDVPSPRGIMRRVEGNPPRGVRQARQGDDHGDELFRAVRLHGDEATDDIDQPGEDRVQSPLRRHPLLLVEGDVRAEVRGCRDDGVRGDVQADDVPEVPVEPVQLGLLAAFLGGLAFAGGKHELHGGEQVDGFLDRRLAEADRLGDLGDRERITAADERQRPSDVVLLMRFDAAPPGPSIDDFQDLSITYITIFANNNP